MSHGPQKNSGQRGGSRNFLFNNSRSAMPPRLPVYLLISLQVLLVQGSTTSSSGKSSAPPARPPARPPPPLGDPSWALGLRLYQALRSDPSSVNTLFSPLLLASSLGALGGGAAGSTANQLKDLLKTPTPSKAGAQAGEILSRALKSFAKANATTFHLHTSSAVFSKQAPAISQAFVKDSRAKFGLQHQPLGKGDSKADLKQLHDWAKDGLGGLEAAPMEAEIKAKAGALILANALHFKGLWEREFSEGSTERRTFLGKKYTKVVMMHRAGLFRHHEDIENMVQVLEAPLRGGKASMVLLLPFHVENLARLDKLLTLELLSTWLEKTNVTSVSISLPKANISSTFSLHKQLLALGLTDAWDQKVADFSGMSVKSKGKLHLGGVLHWASLELAAQAGTGEADLEEENVGKTKLFYADHPFILFVRDNATGALLLMGALDHADGEALHDEL
ncbi:serine (or cysteine) peptidase inhibitor, clade H, member 2 isoform X2 [Hippoglossus stenolepis]|uniref:serine (or cysteine) peptidase inhibitor, clade H, member 2 isoform X2 n=1 Tax=Hippoglossus stenolepis TaxID=195615 RepID=UPI001FAE997C|nr:serine (or cysteine) peptidase inhibitor, clade H, member 2 isoform X2 [Hippoglossus stenolepis]XP_035005491.2 serine (or cysteine) peptidase inhibitor, clade H, member 2 isoform X2 [Hippoglossus stenolepis]